MRFKGKPPSAGSLEWTQLTHNINKGKPPDPDTSMSKETTWKHLKGYNRLWHMARVRAVLSNFGCV